MIVIAGGGNFDFYLAGALALSLAENPSGSNRQIFSSDRVTLVC